MGTKTEVPTQPTGRFSGSSGALNGSDTQCLENTTFLTKPEMAEYLKVSLRYLDMLVSNHKIPVCRLGPKCVRFHRQHVEKALEKYEVSAVCVGNDP